MTTHTAITDYFAGATLDAGSLLCHRTTDATVKTASATGEISAGSAVYSAVFSDVAAGRYRLKLLSGGDVVATRDVEFTGVDAEVVETGYAVLDSAARVKLAADQPDYVPATASALSSLAGKFAGITLLADWLRRAFRKDAGTPGMATAETEIQTGGTSTFTGTTDSLEAIRDASGGGGGGSATVENQTTIIGHLVDIKGAGWSATTDTLKKIRDAISNVIANLIVVPGPILTPVGMPATLEIGDSYEEDAALTIYIRDENDDPVSAAVGHDFTDGDFAPTFVIAPTPGSPRGRVTGTVSYVVPGGLDEPYLKVEIPSSQSKRAVAGEASVQLVLKWPGAEKTLLNTTVQWLPRI